MHVLIGSSLSPGPVLEPIISLILSLSKDADSVSHLFP